ncbi:hypothetical protein LCGC14_2154950 [marine sediment metagenome]|uniref:UPF0033 domain-containing protein n=1 Tax=marine sediment metagenome TaxID=412755 RepID=A0A0F9EGQ0_9ZZZZ|nr:sulfurtransferase TusA family protein [Spirochaetota bacterium]
MAEVLDCKGLKCPQPVLKVAIKARTIPAGTSLEVLADCESFSDDIKKWCEDSGKVLVSCVDQGGFVSATIQF